MNPNIKIILIAIIALAIGLGAGYFLFGKDNAQDTHDNHSDQMTETPPGEEQVWTCSMHPQIRRSEPGLCPICEMDLIPLDNSPNDDPLVLTMTKEAVKLANVQTTILGESGKAEKSILLNGKVREDERLAASLVAHIPGRIEQLFVTFTGEQVTIGQKLASIYSPDLITAQRELLEAIKFKDINPDLESAARNKLKYWKISDGVIDDIAASGTIREIFTLFAETGGVVTDRRVSVGDYVNQGQVLFEIMDLDKVWVIFDAYEEDLANIRLGNRVEFTTPAIPGRTFKTRVTYIDPVINPKTRVAAVRAEVSNRNGLLKPEMFVKGEIVSGISAKEKLMVPKSAVLWTGKRSVVYLRIPDTEIPSFEYREVEIGEAVGDSYLVIAGLEAGEEVVTYGNFAIDAAAQLNNQQSMMNKVVVVEDDQVKGLPDYSADAPEAFKKQLHDLADAYIGLKDALVATNATAASENIKDFQARLEGVDMGLLKGEAHLYWMDLLKGLQSHAEKINTNEEVEAQRLQFSFLSELMIKSIKVFGLDEGRLYVQYCPMAIGDKGADWLSLESEIRNPYFGDKMLKCGTVEDTLSF